SVGAAGATGATAAGCAGRSAAWEGAGMSWRPRDNPDENGHLAGWRSTPPPACASSRGSQAGNRELGRETAESEARVAMVMEDSGERWQTNSSADEGAAWTRGDSRRNGKSEQRQLRRGLRRRPGVPVAALPRRRGRRRSHGGPGRLEQMRGQLRPGGVQAQLAHRQPEALAQQVGPQAGAAHAAAETGVVA